MITGASRGLGRALALAFAREGADLVLNSRETSAADLRVVAREAEARGARVITVTADVSNRADVERLAALALDRFGRVDVLINNASALGPLPMPYLSDYPPDAWDDVLRTNVTGPFLLTRSLVGQMLVRGSGSVINVSSDAGIVGYPTWGAYGVSKAALDQLTRTWAAELEGTGVRVNAVDPGSMDTAMHRAAEPDEDSSQWAHPSRWSRSSSGWHRMPRPGSAAGGSRRSPSACLLKRRRWRHEMVTQTRSRAIVDGHVASRRSTALSAAATARTGATISFELPAALEARTPPEVRAEAPGRRDAVRLLVLDRISGAVTHTTFDRLDMYLRPGDLLVLNASRTMPALLHAVTNHGEQVEVRLADRRGARRWDALLLDGRTHVGREGMRLIVGDGLRATVIGRRPDLPFLWRLRFNLGGTALLDAIERLGEPVRYGYVAGALPLDLYQTVYATEPGSVEMPSAGRPLSWELLLCLRRKGIGVATLVLHTGLSSTRDDAIDALHPNYDEAFAVSQGAADAVNATHAAGGRVIAVGTTVVRALESVTGPDGVTRAGRGRTRLRIRPDTRLHAVDGLLTGLHEPRASHLDLLSALVRPELLQAAYEDALARGYLWHEFGDMNLIA
jgi:S-adenosylmethionine:tRNA ribosyltransferase-isomerase